MEKSIEVREVEVDEILDKIEENKCTCCGCGDL